MVSLLPIVVSDVEHTILISNAGDQTNPAIYENIVVWDDDSGTSSDIFGYNFETGTQFTICDADGDQVNPEVSGNYVVWTDYRNDVNLGDIYGYELSTGTEFAICTDASNQEDSDVYGGLVVWVDFRNSVNDIYMYNIATSTEVELYTSAYNKFNVRISGNRVVWQELISGYFVIHVLNLDTHSMSTFTGNGGNQTEPDVSGSIVVWEDSTYGSDIVGYDFNTASDLLICNGDAAYPSIDGNLIVWTDYRNGIADVYGYDLNTSTEFEVSVGDPSYQGNPAVSKGVVVWEDWRSGNYDIHYAILGYDDWGPTAMIYNVSPDPSNNSPDVTVTANINDARTGISTITGAEYFIGTVGAPGTGTVIDPSDGAYDSYNEDLSFEVDVSSWASGSYTIYVRGQDDQGNWGATDDYAFAVNNDFSGPAVSNVDVDPDPARCQNTVTLTATISDVASGGSIITSAEYSVDSEITTHGTGNPMDVSDGTFDEHTEDVTVTVDITSLGAGAHTVYVYGRDQFENWGAAGTYEFTVILDCTGPDTSNGSVSPDPALNETSVTITADADDSSNGNSNIAAAEFFVTTTGDDGTGTPMAATDGTFDSPTEALTGTLDITGLSSGTYTAYVHSKDQYDNWGDFHQFTFDVSFDFDAPTVSGVDVTPDPARCTVTIYLTAVVSDSLTGGHDIVAAECSLDAEIATHGTGVAMAASDGNFDSDSEEVNTNVDTSSLASGDHTVYVYGQDSYGNWSNYGSYTFTYIDDCLGPVTSNVALDPNPAQNNEFTELTADINDTTTGGSAIKGAEYFIDAPGTIGTGFPMNPFSPPFSSVFEPAIAYIDASALSTGTHTIYVHGKDQYDNWGAYVTISLEISSSGEIQLTDDDYDQYGPVSIYDSLVVYDDDRDDVSVSDDIYDYNIFLYNISTSQEVRITDDPNQQRDPDIYGDVIVWTDLRNDSGYWTNYDIYGCRPGPDDIFGNGDDVEFQLTTDANAQTQPAIYGDIVVWMDNRNGNYDIYGRRPGPDGILGNGDDVEFQLTSGASSQMYPAIYDGVIVWQDNISGSFDNDIHGCYPGTDDIFGTGDDQFFIVDSNTSNQTNSDVSGDNIVWQDDRNKALGKYGANWDVYGVNSGTDGLFGTGDDVGFQLSTDTAHQEEPKINGSFIVWKDDRDNSSYYEIYIYDLGDDGIFGTVDDTAEYRITRDGSGKSSPDVSQYYVVWPDSRDGNEIYAYQIGGGGGGSISVAADPNCIVSNGVAISTISATVRDSGNNLVPNGTQVSFSSDAGSLSASIATTTDGIATVTLTSSTTVETAEVTAAAMGANDTALVFFTSSSTGIDSITQESVTNGTMDVRTEANTEIDVNGTADVTVAKYTGNPGDGFSGGALDSFIDVYIPDVSLVVEIEIRLYYTDDDVVGIDESTLKLNYWDGTSWSECSITGVDTDANYVWATINDTTHPSLADLQAMAFGGEGVKTFLDIDVTLLGDWNLVSFSHIPTDPSIGSVLESFGEVDYVYRWDPETDAYEYSHYINETLGWQGQFAEIDRVNGFWIHCTSNPLDDLELLGVPDGPEQIELLADWNLVSWQKRESMSISDALGDIEPYVEYVYRWDPDTDAYEYSHYINETLGWQGQFNTLDPDYGYWFYCTQACTWDTS